MTPDQPPAPPRRPFELGLRRPADLEPDAPLPDSNPDLVARIADEIRAHGPMSFARFMELALYDPTAGYYTGAMGRTGSSGSSGRASGSGRLSGPGRSGDFLTAPEGHPIFGWAIARHLESVWAALDRPSSFVVREHGAGSGALAAGILAGLRRPGSPLLEAISYQAADIAPGRLDALAERLAADNLDRYLAPPNDRAAPGAVIANELLDALPIHRVEGGPGGTLLERFVTIAGTADATPSPGVPPSAVPDGHAGPPNDPSPFATVLGALSTPALATRLASERIVLEPGQPAEICLAIDDWVAHAVAPLERGELLLIDYGYPADELYTPARGSTLRAYHRHRVHADPLVGIGRQDLTAHVDLTAVERAAIAAGLESLGRTTQARFLANLGAGELLVALQTDPASTVESYFEARSALVRMLDPRATGAFAVVGFGRGLPVESPPRGFDPA